MSRKTSLWLRVAAFTTVLLAGVSTPTFAQEGPYSVRIVQVDTSGFPEIDVWVSVVDAQGNPVTSLPNSTFALIENGQQVTVTGVSRSGEQEAGAVNVVLAIDRSGSMNERGKIEAAKAAATAFVDRMRPEDATGVIAFNTQVEVIQPLTSDKAALKTAIAGIQAFDDTAMYDGLAASVEMLSGAQGRRAVILLSDGIDNRSQRTADDILNSDQAAELSVFAIGLGDPSAGTGRWAGIDESALRAIAERSRGSYTYAPDAQALADLYGQLSHELQNEYRVSYVTSNTVRDGIERAIQVQVSGVGDVQSIYNPGGVIPETSQALAWPVFGGLLLGLVALLALPGLLRGPNGGVKGIGLLRRKSRVKLTGGQGAKQAHKSGAAKPRVRVQGKGG